MTARYSLVLSGNLDNLIGQVVSEDQSSKAKVLRKALALYLAARDGSRRGMKVGLVDPASERLEMEFIGL